MRYVLKIEMEDTENTIPSQAQLKSAVQAVERNLLGKCLVWFLEAAPLPNRGTREDYNNTYTGKLLVDEERPSK